MTSFHSILQICNNSLTVVWSVEVPIIARIVKSGTNLSMSLILNSKTNSPVGEPEGSDDFMEVPFDDEQILRQHNTAHGTPPPLAYTPTPPVLTTMEPLDTFLMGEFELTLDSTDLECSMPIDLPLPWTDVLGDTIEFEDISSLDPLESTPVIDESTLIVTPLPASKKFSLREVERFDPFFSLTQSGGITRVMETPSFSSHHMPSPRPTAYSTTEVMYCYYHPHLTSSDGFDHGPKMK
ncbi:hypothetical protein Tco_0669172 [Tanacetum coccineum]